AFKEDLFTTFTDQPKFEKALATLDDGFEDTIQYMNEPVKLHPHIRSTNSLERLNQEVRRRERVIRIFPNTQSAFRLIGAVLMHQEKTQYSQKKGLTK
ncbi:transposase, partial [Planococcus glaciei]|uniref:transposase n=2 Tax=Planococcus glaciei TaxID=459472 RepID=UPI000B124E95